MRTARISYFDEINIDNTEFSIFQFSIREDQMNIGLDHMQIRPWRPFLIHAN